MSLQGKNNKNAAKRIYHLNTLNNPVILDLFKNQDTKLNINNNILYHTNTKEHDEKNSLLSITGKEVICPNIYLKNNNKRTTRNDTELVKNIK